MKFLRLNPELSKVNITYWLAGMKGKQSRSINNIPLKSGWPALIPTLNLPGHYILRSTLTLSNSEVIAGYSVYQLQAGDQMMPPQSDLEYTLVQGPNKVPTKDYATRKAAGEVLMNDYLAGTIVVKRSASYDYTGGTVDGQKDYGWLTFPTDYPLTCAPPVYGIQVGETLRLVSVNLAYDLVSVPNAAYDISPDPVFLDDTFQVDTELVTSVVADCNNGTIDLLTELVELPETVQFVTESTKKAFFLSLEAEAERRYMRKVLPLERFLKWSANNWLKLRYALLPIFYSIMDVSKVLKEMKAEYGEYRAQKVLNSSAPVDLLNGYLSFETEGDRVHRCMIKSRYTPDNIMSQFRRLININLLSTALEVTRLSFVAGWVVNLDDFLSAVSSSDGSTDSKCCYSIKDNRTVTLSYSNSPERPQTVISFWCYERQVINPVDHIGLSLRFDMNWKRYLDAASLSLKPAISIIKSRSLK